MFGKGNDQPNRRPEGGAPGREDARTEYLGGDDKTEFLGRDDRTEYIGRPESAATAGSPGAAYRQEDYNPDADFAWSDADTSQPRGQITNETQILSTAAANPRPQQPAPPRPQGRPLPEQRQPRGRNGGGYNAMPPREQRRQAAPRRESRGGSRIGKAALVVTVVAILAILALVIAAMNFFNGNNSAAPVPNSTTSRTTAPSPSPRPTEPPTSETSPISTLDSARQRVQDEIDNIKQNPPALPGLGETGSGWGNLPVGVVGKSPAVVEAELRVNGYQNITIYDAQGNPTNSAAAVLGRVASIDPPEGQAAETSTPVSIHLQ